MPQTSADLRIAQNLRQHKHREKMRAGRAEPVTVRMIIKQALVEASADAGQPIDEGWVIQWMVLHATDSKTPIATQFKCVEAIGRHLGMFVDRQEHSGPGGGPIEIQGATPADQPAIQRVEAIYASRLAAIQAA